MRPLSDLPLFGSRGDSRAPSPNRRQPGAYYPDAPGFKAGGPSQEAAEAIRPRAPRLRTLVLSVFKDAAGGMTADQAAAVLDLPILSVRPRVAELHRLGELRRTEERRKNTTGMTATVWRVADALPGLPRATDAPDIASAAEPVSNGRGE